MMKMMKMMTMLKMMKMMLKVQVLAKRALKKRNVSYGLNSKICVALQLET